MNGDHNHYNKYEYQQQILRQQQEDQRKQKTQFQAELMQQQRQPQSQPYQPTAIAAPVITQPPLPQTYRPQYYQPQPQSYQQLQPPLPPPPSAPVPQLVPQPASSRSNGDNGFLEVQLNNMHINQSYNNVNNNQFSSNMQDRSNTQNPVQDFAGQQPQQQFAHMNVQQPQPYQQQSNINVVRYGFDKVWGSEAFDLLQNTVVWPQGKVEIPPVDLKPYMFNTAQCDPEIFRCSFRKIPQSKELLEKSKLPLGLTIHPFKDLSNLSIVESSRIIRCFACRAYINPFVTFSEQNKWRCNICFRSNELPNDFYYDPQTQELRDPRNRPEIRNCTIEYIATNDYFSRPPAPATYLYLIDVSSLAVSSGYLKTFCAILKRELDNIPSDKRTMIGFVAFDSYLHFYCIHDSQVRPREMIICDLAEIWLPHPENLLTNLSENKRSIIEFLDYLPTHFGQSYDNKCALGAAIEAAQKLLSNEGGRVSIFITRLPNVEPGQLEVREVPTQRTDKDTLHLHPYSDYYKKIALDSINKTISFDLFVLNSQYVDLASICCLSKFTGGSVHHFPLYKESNIETVAQFENCFRRYLTRKIGFDSVLRARCSRGLSVHSFHGNAFVRSLDLLVLPTVSPDSAFGIHLNIDENLADLPLITFQIALLYTSAIGERKIRVHTICFPVTSSLQELYLSADPFVIVSMFAKMGVDLAIDSGISDAKEALVNHLIFLLSTYRVFSNSLIQGLPIPVSLSLLPLLTLALLKYTCFQSGKSIPIDTRVSAMLNLKNYPLSLLIQAIYPDLYMISELGTRTENNLDLPRLALNSKNLNLTEIYLLDYCDIMIVFCGSKCPYERIEEMFGNVNETDMTELPTIDTNANRLLHLFVRKLQSAKPYDAALWIAREESAQLTCFVEKMIEDKTNRLTSYVEFLQHLKNSSIPR